MAVSVSTQLYYAIADVLGMTIQRTAETNEISGSRKRNVDLAGLHVAVNCTIVSSRVTTDCVMVLAKVLGNLALFVAAKPYKQTEIVDLYVLNLAKMDHVSGWLEKHKPVSVNDALKKLDKAVVRGFVKTKKNEWDKAA